MSYNYLKPPEVPIGTYILGYFNGDISLKRKLVSEAKSFTFRVYFASKSFPEQELFGITSQLRRAAVSITCNIVEGFARDDWDRSKKELLRFMEIAYGSLVEVKFLLELFLKAYKANKNDMTKLQKEADRIGALLFGFIKSLRRRVRRESLRPY